MKTVFAPRNAFSIGLLFALIGCVATTPSVRDPDQGVQCLAADGSGMVFIRCGRFALTVIDVDPALDDQAVAKVYRSVVEAAVKSEVLVKKRMMSVGGTIYQGFKWETPDRVAPRSGLVLAGAFAGKRSVVTCEVRDAGRTAEERCQARIHKLLSQGLSPLEKVTLEVLHGLSAEPDAGAASSTESAPEN